MPAYLIAEIEVDPGRVEAMLLFYHSLKEVVVVLDRPERVDTRTAAELQQGVDHGTGVGCLRVVNIGDAVIPRNTLQPMLSRFELQKHPLKDLRIEPKSARAQQGCATVRSSLHSAPIVAKFALLWCKAPFSASLHSPAVAAGTMS